MASFKQCSLILLIVVVLIQSGRANHLKTEQLVEEGSSVSLEDNFANVTYEKHRSNNLDNYLKAAGFGIINRLQLKNSRATVSLGKFGEEYVLISWWMGVGFEVQKFKPYVPYSYRTIDGRDVKAVMVVVGPLLFGVQEGAEKGRVTGSLRLFLDNALLEILYCHNVLAENIYLPQRK